jgi:glycosyltransferase involved in cell wall biosynthesis
VKRKNVVVLATGIDSGGTERNALDFFRRATTHFSRSIFIVFGKKPKNFEDKDVLFLGECSPLDHFRNGRGLLRDLGWARHEDTVIVSFGEYAHTLMLAFSISNTVRGLIVLRCSTTLSSYLRYRFARFLLAYVTYGIADAVVVQSAGMLRDFRRTFPFLKKKKLVVVKNGFIGWQGAAAPLAENLTYRQFCICVGRLRPEKGHSRLIDLYKAAKINVKFVFIGDGPLRKELEEKVQRLGLEERIIFIGEVENPKNFFLQALGVFVPSYYEGSSNVVVEANHFSLPIGAFNDCEAMRELQASGVPVSLVDPVSQHSFAKMLENWNTSQQQNQQASINVPENPETTLADEYKRLFFT